MNAWIRAARTLVLGTAATWLAAAPAAALDVLGGLVPADFTNDRLLAAEARAFAPQRATVAVPVDSYEEANPLGRTQGATTLSELGVGSGATELAVSGAGGDPLLANATAEERRVLGTLAALGGVLSGASDGGGVVGGLDGVLDDLDAVLGGDGSTEDLIEDLLGDDGLVPSLLDPDGGLLDLPVDELQEVLDQLPVELPIRLPNLLQ
jgi:hypothetical protein